MCFIRHCLYSLHRIVGDKDTLVDVPQEHRKNYLDDDKGNTYRITVRRSEIWKDAIQSLKRYFDVSSIYVLLS